MPSLYISAFVWVQKRIAKGNVVFLSLLIGLSLLAFLFASFNNHLIRRTAVQSPLFLVAPLVLFLFSQALSRALPSHLLLHRLEYSEQLAALFNVTNTYLSSSSLSLFESSESASMSLVSSNTRRRFASVSSSASSTSPGPDSKSLLGVFTAAVFPTPSEAPFDLAK